MIRNTLALLLLVITIPAVHGESVTEDAKPKAKKLAKEFAPMTNFIGTWEVNAEWKGGGKLWARNEFNVGLGGKFVDSVTYAKDGDGDPYARYRTIFSFDKKKKQFVSHGFTYDGTVSTVEMKHEETKDGRSILISQWQPPGGTTSIKQRLEVIDNDNYRWQVWSRANDEGDWGEIMDATWKRVVTNSLK